MDMLYRNMEEVSRVVEEVDVTEDGQYKKDRTPEDYGGSLLKILIVHRVTLADASGRLLTLKFSNPEPKNKVKETEGLAGSITLDGNQIASGAGGDPRTWTTVRNPTLSPRLASLVQDVEELQAQDGISGSVS